MNLTRLETLPPVRAVGIRLLRLHQKIYVRSGGRIGHRLANTRNLLLYTTGARTGQPRTNALAYARDGSSYDVVAGTTTSSGRWSSRFPSWC